MKKIYILLLSSFFFITAKAQQEYIGIGIGAVYAQYKQPSFDAMKKTLSDSLHLKMAFKPNTKSPGISFSIFKGVEKKSQFTFNCQFMLTAESQINELGHNVNLAQYATNMCFIGGLYLVSWLRLDFGLGLSSNKLILKEIGGFSLPQSKVTDDNFHLFLSPCFELGSKKEDRGISISPYYQLGINKFDHRIGFGTFQETYAGEKDSRLNSIGVDVKILLRKF